jgi:hypothetical protein
LFSGFFCLCGLLFPYKGATKKEHSQWKFPPGAFMTTPSRLARLAPAIAAVFYSAAASSVTTIGSDSFTGAESVMSPRFFRPGTPGAQCSTTSSGNFQYRTYQIENNGSGQLNASFNNGSCALDIYVTFHEGGFDPANICAGHVWSFGTSTSFSNQVFNVTPNSVITMTVNGVTNAPNVACGPYSWNISTLPSKNIFLRKLKAKNSPKVGEDAWQASYVYNDDRREAHIFNPATDAFAANFGGKLITIPAGSFNMLPSGIFTYKSPAGETPAYTVKVTPSKQTIDVKVSKIDDFGFDFPGKTLTNEVGLGKNEFLFDTTLSGTGTYLPLTAYPQDNFAVSSASLKNTGVKEKTSFTAKMYLESPNLFSNFIFSDCKDKCNQPSVILRLKDSGNALLEKDLTGLVYATAAPDSKTGSTIYTLKKLGKDPSPENVLNALSYSNKTGAFNIALGKVNLLTGVTSYQSSLQVELVIDGYTFRTNVTMFAADKENNTYNSTFSKFSPI